MTEALANTEELNRLNYLQVCDSMFPVGAFALSNGMETFVQRDLIRSESDFEEYLHDYLEVAAYKEVGHMVLAGRLADDRRASQRTFEQKLTALDELVDALQSPREIREGQHKMCIRLIKLADQMEDNPLQARDVRQQGKVNSAHNTGNAVHDAHGSNRMAQPAGRRRAHEVPSSSATSSENDMRGIDQSRTIPHLDAYARLIAQGDCYGLHAIAMGLFAADKAPNLREAAVTYCYSLLSALVVCAVKAVPISQFAGQIALRNSFPDVVRAVDLAFRLEPDDLGVSGAYLDIASMQHETLYSRLYMS